MFHLTATHPSGTGQRYSAKSPSIQEVANLVASLRGQFPGYHVTVANSGNCMVHTFRPSETFDHAFVN